jgi:hypothetical protein
LTKKPDLNLGGKRRKSKKVKRKSKRTMKRRVKKPKRKSKRII